MLAVPNPLFDLAGILCGQFGIPFWKFFLATLIGKAIIKTHNQTAFIISVCNHQLLDFIENEIIRLLSFVPGLATVLPKLVAKLQIIRNKYMAPAPTVSNIAVGKWDFSFASIWNTVILLMLTTFIIKIVTATAQSFLKEQQEKELALYNSSFASSSSSSKTI
ncbi:MEMBRANE-ASSOCIATED PROGESTERONE RECEPTOR COMPONENT-RELATED [Salix purpurea]|uniref:MEMBRANE-ASSOCIATED PROGESTERONE RECEPTOR COMPONENT-RELATED n=1 Tax=Salix purpurea TaxID=77065 RepID=A0A9Q0WYQ1_SALPP|nr:MEMBRANE-ASSOCIATED PROGESTERONE RECEPTOR COMPONENT-RELATED [Salix purpurea]